LPCLSSHPLPLHQYLRTPPSQRSPSCHPPNHTHLRLSCRSLFLPSSNRVSWEGGFFARGKRGTGRARGRTAHCGGRGSGRGGIFRSGAPVASRGDALVVLLSLRRRAAGLSRLVAGRPRASSASFSRPLLVARAVVGMRLAFPPPRRGVIPKRSCSGLYCLRLSGAGR
jgi:hypothetical protein